VFTVRRVCPAKVLMALHVTWERNRASGVAAARTCAVLAMLCMAVGLAGPAVAGPTDAVNPGFQIGSGNVTGLGTANVTVNQTSNLAKISWESLGNKAGEVLRYNQPSIGSVALNVVGGGDPSHFLGSVFANGSVIFINPNGVFFGPQSQVNVGGLIASSLNITDTNFVKGRYAFEGTAGAGVVRNEGQISAGPFGVYLLAPNVANSGIITTPGGQIALGAGTTAYLASRADGRGFLTEVTAPAGDALNVGRMIADGGQISMIGRLVTQSGLVQANTVQKQNGVVKLVASEQATLSAGSQTIAGGGEIAVSGRVIEQQGTLQSIGTPSRSGRIELIATDQVNIRNGSVTNARGGDIDVSDGGTIAAMATNLANGTVTIESGALLNLSGGVQGGHGGELWFGGVTIPSEAGYSGTALAGFDSARSLVAPRTKTVTAADLSDPTTRSYLNFYAMDNLTVSVPSFNLTSRTIAPASDGSPRAGTLRFFAGNNLTVLPSTIQNGNRVLPVASTGAVNAWNLTGVAGNDIQFQTGAGQTSLWSTGKGSISLQAGRDIKLVPDGGGGATTIQTLDGDISITAGRDLIAPSGLVNNRYTGVRLDRAVLNVADPSQGAGNLDISAGGNFSGGKVNGVEAGPGFVLSNGTARVRVGGNLGSAAQYATFTVGSMGVSSQQSLIAGSQTPVTLDVMAQGDMFIGNVQDRNLSEGLRTPVIAPTPELASVNANSKASFTSSGGDLHLRPIDIMPSLTFSRFLPPSFSAVALNGNIFVESGLVFWSSPVGRLDFLAGQSILGTSGADIRFNCLESTCKPGPSFRVDEVIPITLTAFGGDISNLTLNFVDHSPKLVKITAKNNIRNVSGVFAAPQLTDSAGNQVPAVTITAQTGDIDFSGLTNSQSGFLFGGTGWAKVSAGRNVNLGQSKGLVFQLDPREVTDAGSVNVYNAGGLLELAAGGDIGMNASKIQSNNGADLFIHGLDARPPVAGTTAIATTAMMGGNPVYVVNGQPVRDVTGSPVVVGANDTIVGHSVLVVNGKAVLGVNGKPVAVAGAESNTIAAGDLVHGTAVLDRPLAQLADGTLVAVINGKTVLAAPSGTAVAEGRPGVNSGTVTLLVGGKSVHVVEPVGGAVNVGTSSNTVSDKTGILTVRGGAIDLKAVGDINVNRSRIATLGGGDISLTSTTGDINAGNGPRGEITAFVIEQPGPNGTVFKSTFLVPGSGIFTIHPDDGDLPDIPRFDPISPFHKEVIMHQFLGHDVSDLLPLVPASDEAWRIQYDQSVRDLFAGFRLGDIRLRASHDVIVPPAGIRGRNITIEAGHNLELQGGEIRGVSTVNVGNQVVGSLSSFVGAFAVTLGGISGGTSTTLGLGNITGNVGSVATTSSVTASTSTASLTSSQATAAAESSNPVGESKAAKDRREKKGSGLGGGSLRVRDKVRIKVQTQQE